MVGNDTLRLVACGLLLITLVVVVGALALTGVGKAVPDALIALGSGALGSVGTLLVTGGGSQDVTVTNNPDDPVPVADTQ